MSNTIKSEWYLVEELNTYDRDFLLIRRFITKTPEKYKIPSRPWTKYVITPIEKDDE
jgi:hypothetical protein